MAQKKMSFKESIRRTLVVYALIPVAFLTLTSFLSAIFIFYRTIIGDNHQANATALRIFQETCTSYMEMADSFCGSPNTVACVERGIANVELSRQLYEYINAQDIRCNFYLIDDRQQLLAASSSLPPAYIRSAPVFNIGIMRKVRETPGEVLLSVEATDDPSKKVLAIGKAVMRDEQYLGTLIFEFSEQDFVEVFLSISPVKVFVTDQYYYVCWQTDGLFADKFGKIERTFQEQSGFVRALGTSFYCTCSQVLDGVLRVYTFSEIGNYNRIFGMVGLALVLIFAALAFAIYIASRIIADNKTQVIDEIVETMCHVHGDQVYDDRLSRPLVLNTGDEFELIAESYNQMLSDLGQLMEDKEELARLNVLSEIKQLEAQFEPHFLFNTLELIKYMVRMDPDNVGKVIVGLSNLLRDSLNNALSQLSLDEDICYTENYLLIQKFRFDKRFEYYFRIQPEARGCIVPKRIIQPIVENAMVYGAGRSGIFRLNVEASLQDDCLVITIEDNGKGIEPEKLKELDKLLSRRGNSTIHNGLYNVHRRIRLIYGGQYGLTVDSVQNRGTRITMILPIHKELKEYAEGFNSRG